MNVEVWAFNLLKEIKGKNLSQDFRTMTTNQKQVAQKELFLELRSFKTQSLSNFMFDLHHILKNNQRDSTSLENISFVILTPVIF